MAKSADSATNEIKASIRTETGKGASRRARREGKVPVVLYGRSTEPQHLLLPTLEFAAVLRKSGSNAVVTLDIDGKQQLALTKALDIHPVRRNIQHADLLVIRRGEKVVVEVGVWIVDEAASGTLVTQETGYVEIEADALSIPERLTISVKGAEPGTQFTAGQIPLPPRVSLVSDPETLVVNVQNAPTAEEFEAEITGEVPEAEGREAEAAEPEPEPE